MSSQFKLIINKTNCKRIILEKTRSIIIVKTAKKLEPDKFWRHAFDCHYTFDDINSALHFVKSDIVTQGMIYYKIYIKCGEYRINTSSRYNFHHSKKSITLVGISRAHNHTIINGCSLTIVASQYFTIKNVFFNNYKLSFDTSVDIYVRPLLNGNLNLIGCIFSTIHHIHIITNHTIQIINCTFGKRGIMIDYNLCDIYNGGNHAITNNTFNSVRNGCIMLRGNNNNGSMTISDNYINGADAFINNYFTKCKVYITNNRIDDVRYCILNASRSNTLFENNQFVRVKSITLTRIHGILSMAEGNSFTDCGQEFGSF